MGAAIAKILASRVLSDPDGASSAVKKIIIVVSCVLMGIFLVPAMAISLPGMFGKDSEDADNISFDIADSKLYQQVMETYNEYEADVQVQISNQISSMQAANAAAAAESGNSSSKGSGKSGEKSKSSSSKAKKSSYLPFLYPETQIHNLFYQSEELINKVMPVTAWKDGDLIGTAHVTGYCLCSICNEGYLNGITSTGVTAKSKHTIAVDPKVIPYGTYVKIEGFPGITFKAEDCGGAIDELEIDIYYDSHQEALNFGSRQLKVYYASGVDAPDPDGVQGSVLPGNAGTGAETGIRENDLVGCALAYIMTKYEDVQTKEDSFLFRVKLKREIKKMFDDVTTIKVWQEGSFPNEIYQSSVTIMATSEIANKYFKDQEKQEIFLCSLESFSDQTMESGNTIAGGSDAVENIKYPESGMKIPLYLQYDPQWGSLMYGSANMAASACGPTSMAMVLSYLTGQTISPVTTAQWSVAHGYRIPGAGTGWDFYIAAPKAWGCNGKKISVDATAIATALQAGHPVITSMKPGTFTKAGHFIVLCGITPDGKILVNDPNDKAGVKDFYKKQFSMDLILNEAKGAWEISKN